MLVTIVNIEQSFSTLTLISLADTHISTFVLPGVVTVLLIGIIRITTAVVTIARDRTASRAGLARTADRIDNISIFIISIMGAVVSRRKTALIFSVPISKCDISTLAWVVLVRTDVST